MMSGFARPPPRSEPASVDLGIRGETTPVRGATAARPGVQAAPPVRKLARELGVDLDAVAGTGPGGRVTANDVRAAVAAAPADAPAREAAGAVDGEQRVPLRGIRRAMARNMAEAWRTVPHISLFDEIDARPLLDALRNEREQSGSRSLTLTAFFVRASVLALAAQPILNASLDEATDEIVYHDAVNVGVAVASDDGLVVPVVHNAQSLGLRALGDEINRLTTAARARWPSARGDTRGHVLGHQLRDRRRAIRDPDRPPTPGRDPRVRSDPPAARGRRRCRRRRTGAAALALGRPPRGRRPRCDQLPRHGRGAPSRTGPPARRLTSTG